MINFKQIELSDRPEIECGLQKMQYRNCDFSFTNLIAWASMFKTHFAIVHKTLFIRFCDGVTTCSYMMPVNGNLTTKQAIEMIMEDAKQNNVPFQMKGVTEQMWEEIEKTFPGVFDYKYDRANDEYIYLSEKLISLSGKKLQSKRNHINRFKADNPDWEYFPLSTQKDLTECLAMLGVWEEQHIQQDPSLKYDYLATKMMLENFDALRLKGGGIRVNGKLIAFTLGEKLTDDTFVVHVEKAFADINGAYTIINQQFAEHEGIRYKYINREEDMGLESLRKAKLSYQPEILLQERVVFLKEKE